MEICIPFIAFAISAIIMPLIIRFARKHNIVDKPGERKIHKKPTPLLGGLGILIAFILPLFFFVEFSLKTIVIAISLIVITLFGALDDMYDIKAGKKLIVQIICTLAVVGTGVRLHIGQFFIPNKILATTLDMAISSFWSIGIINAINLIDGIDGLAGGVSFLSAIGFLIMGVIGGNILVIVLTSLLAGAVLGFLIYNFHPAKIFMGDAGSTFLGFAFAIISLSIPNFEANKASIFAPVFILAVPIFDTGISILRRAFMGNGIFTADDRHIHHRLLHRGISQTGTVTIIYTMALISIILGLFIYNIQQLGLGVLFIAIYIFFGVGISMKEAYFGEMISRVAVGKQEKARR